MNESTEKTLRETIKETLLTQLSLLSEASQREDIKGTSMQVMFTNAIVTVSNLLLIFE